MALYKGALMTTCPICQNSKDFIRAGTIELPNKKDYHNPLVYQRLKCKVCKRLIKGDLIREGA